MNETQLVSELIANIYDAALDKSLWPGVLEKSCRFLNAATGTILSQDTVSGSAEFYYQWGNDEDFLRSYQETYVRLNPVLVAALVQGQIGDVLSTVDLLPLDEFFASRFYKEWVAPQGLIDSIFATLDKSASRYAIVALTRHEREGLVDEAARRRMRLLAPHFSRAVAISNLIDLKSVRAAALTDTLDAISAAVFLVDARGCVVHANSAGQEMLDDESVLRIAAGRLLPSDGNAAKLLHEIITNATHGHDTAETRDIAIHLGTRGGEPYLAHVLLLTTGARRSAVNSHSAVAVVFARKAELELPHPVEVLATTYKLTPTEMRVLMMIVDVGGVAEVAQALGTAPSTVKTHLLRIFQKTGATRQVDLVKLIASCVATFGGRGRQTS